MRGDIIRIADGPIEVELLPEVGARLHRIRAFGHDLLRTPKDPLQHVREPFFWGAYVMAPWCNRMAAVPTVVGDRTIDPAANFPDGTAIHGRVAATPWIRRPDGALMARGGADGWPWRYEVTQRVTVVGALVRIDLALTNLDDEPMPGGIGLHPWFRRPLDVGVSGRSVLPSNLDAAARVEPIDGGHFDLRHRRPLADGLDATWLDLGEPAVALRWPDIGLEATTRVRSAAEVSVAVASPSDIDAVAVEPQTHAPWGLRRFLAGEPHGLQALAPGASLNLVIEIEVRRSS